MIPLRVEFDRGICRATNRGDRRVLVFRDDQGREIFLESLSACCAKTDWRVHGNVETIQNQRRTLDVSSPQ